MRTTEAGSRNRHHQKPITQIRALQDEPNHNNPYIQESMPLSGSLSHISAGVRREIIGIFLRNGEAAPKLADLEEIRMLSKSKTRLRCVHLFRIKQGAHEGSIVVTGSQDILYHGQLFKDGIDDAICFLRYIGQEYRREVMGLLEIYQGFEEIHRALKENWRKKRRNDLSLRLQQTLLKNIDELRCVSSVQQIELRTVALRGLGLIQNNNHQAASGAIHQFDKTGIRRLIEKRVMEIGKVRMELAFDTLLLNFQYG